MPSTAKVLFVPAPRVVGTICHLYYILCGPVEQQVDSKFFAFFSTFAYSTWSFICESLIACDNSYCFYRYGVISTPEVADWWSISGNDTFLVATSDGVFEKLTTQDACDILFQEKIRLDMIQEGISSTNLAELLLTHALERGTMDNVAAVVVPLWLASRFWYNVEEVKENPAMDLLWATKGDNANYGSILEKEYYDLMTARFHRSFVRC